ncbi:MAG: hypothetical protein HZB29_02825 [Nitrospinae bacterium]|nr:hypothetical protein [Nitrospinota bacterium]
MAQIAKVVKLWEHAHRRPVESLSVAGETGEVLLCDRRDSVVLLGPEGKVIHDEPMPLAPVDGEVASDGQSVFILSFEGFLSRMRPDGGMDWEKWVDRDGATIAVRAKGQSAVVASHKGRFFVISSSGERLREVHTPEPVAHAVYASRAGTLFLASSMGWIGIYDKQANPTGEFHINHPIMDLKVCESGKKIFLPAGEDGFNVINSSSEEMTTINPGFYVAKLGINRNGDLIAAVCPKGNLALLNLSGDVLWSEKTKDSWALCGMTGDGTRFVAVNNKGLAVCYGVMGMTERKAPPPPEPAPRKAPAQKERAPERQEPGKSDLDYLEL